MLWIATTYPVSISSSAPLSSRFSKHGDVCDDIGASRCYEAKFIEVFALINWITRAFFYHLHYLSPIRLISKIAIISISIFDLDLPSDDIFQHPLHACRHRPHPKTASLVLSRPRSPHALTCRRTLTGVHQAPQLREQHIRRAKRLYCVTQFSSWRGGRVCADATDDRAREGDATCGVESDDGA